MDTPSVVVHLLRLSGLLLPLIVLLDNPPAQFLLGKYNHF